MLLDSVFLFGLAFFLLFKVVVDVANRLFKDCQKGLLFIESRLQNLRKNVMALEAKLGREEDVSGIVPVSFILLRFDGHGLMVFILFVT